MGLELGLAFSSKRCLCGVGEGGGREWGKRQGLWADGEYNSALRALGWDALEQLDLTGVCPSELALSLQQCEQLVAELQGNVRQAVHLYHLVSTGQKLVGRSPAGCAGCLTAERLEC